MPISKACRIVIGALSLCVIAGCQSQSVTSGAGYSFVRFTNPQAALLASQDVTAGPAIATNNRRCALDTACKK
jgi:hypothetical protein